MSLERKLRDLDFGRFAEDLAAEHYISEGYAIRERNWRFHHIEIDIIAQMGNTIVFVEVKARSGRDQNPVEAVNMRKMRSIARGADVYLKCMRGDYEYRYDIFALTGDKENYTYEVIEDAYLSPLS